MNQEEKKQTLLGYLFLVPSLAVFAVFMFYPLFYTVYLSFFEWNMVKPVKKFVIAHQEYQIAYTYFLSRFYFQLTVAGVKIHIGIEPRSDGFTCFAYSTTLLS